METYGELKKILTAISRNQKGGKVMSMGKEVAIDALIGLIPGGGAAKTALGFLQAAFKRPDTEKTNTWLDKLDIDDKVSKIVDDTVENAFMEYMLKKIEAKSDQEQLGDDFNMNTELQSWLSDTYDKRTVSFMNETIARGYAHKKIKNKISMKKSQLKQLIKEEIQNILNEEGETNNSTPAAPPVTQNSLRSYLIDLSKKIPTMSKDLSPQELKAFDRIVKATLAATTKPGVNLGSRLEQLAGVLEKLTSK